MRTALSPSGRMATGLSLPSRCRSWIRWVPEPASSMRTVEAPCALAWARMRRLSSGYFEPRPQDVEQVAVLAPYQPSGAGRPAIALGRLRGRVPAVDDLIVRGPSGPGPEPPEPVPADETPLGRDEVLPVLGREGVSTQRGPEPVEGFPGLPPGWGTSFGARPWNPLSPVLTCWGHSAMEEVYSEPSLGGLHYEYGHSPRAT